MRRLGMVAFLPIATGLEGFSGDPPGSVYTNEGFCSFGAGQEVCRAIKVKAGEDRSRQSRAGRCSH